MNLKESGRCLLRDFKGDSYIFGLDCLGAVAQKANVFGKRVLLVLNDSPWIRPILKEIELSLSNAKMEVIRRCAGARPNAPREDVYNIQEAIEETAPEVIIAMGGGSTLDAAKAAAALAAVSPGVHNIDPLFGVGKVTELLEGRKLLPLVAVETAASSASHLTKYSNVTDIAAGQKKLISDEAIVPPAAVFDYSVTLSTPKELTCDGAFDGISHCFEVYCGASAETLDKVERIALTGIELIVSDIEAAVRDPENLAAREALGLGTDLGGYAIMLGGTNAAHLTSFSLVDVTTHGRACAIMNPYYMVLFAPAIERQMRGVAAIFVGAGLLESRASRLSGRDLALALAEAMMALIRRLGLPTSLGELPGFSPGHIERAVRAAKDPQLRMKLRQMPVPMNEAMVEEYITPVLEAAAEGDLKKVKTFRR